jgi:uncharacterized protein GlcG (DUF336 family)
LRFLAFSTARLASRLAGEFCGFALPNDIHWEVEAMRNGILAGVMLAFIGALAPAVASETVVTYKSVTPEVAIEAVQAAVKKCREDGYQVAAVVIDRFGQAQALMRDRYAGLPATQTATDKAYTALSFRSDTSGLNQLVKSGKMSERIAIEPRILMIPGGLIIETAGTLMGAVGVSGAPTGEADEACAKAALDQIHEKIDF